MKINVSGSNKKIIFLDPDPLFSRIQICTSTILALSGFGTVKFLPGVGCGSDPY